MGAIRTNNGDTVSNGKEATNDTEKRIPLFGFEIDVVDMQQAIRRIYGWIDRDDHLCRYVVTPNVDHTVMLQYDVNLKRAYDDASLIVADGSPIVLASRLLKKPLPERVTGADLVQQMFTAAADRERPLTVFLLGAASGVGEKAAANIQEKWSNVEVVGVDSPPLGFHNNKLENQRILRKIAEANPDMLVVGLGAPKQEIWVHAQRNKIEAKAAFCVGATIDFLAGHRSRAPIWMQKCGLEWLYRMGSEPGRLGRRYLHDAFVFPGIFWREWLHGSK